MSTRPLRRATLTAAAAAMVVAGTAAPAGAATPTVATSPPDSTLITDTYALISGVINPNGIASAYHFEYGPTSSYGTTTPDTSAGNGKAEVPVDYSLDELTPATTYHYRLVGFPDAATGSAYAAIGQIPGADQSFTTAKALAVYFVKKSSKISVDDKGKTAVSVSAVGPVDEVAKGKIKLTAKIKHGKKKATTKTIATKAFRVKVGVTKSVTVKLSSAARKQLAKAGSLKAKASAGTATASYTLKG